MLENIFEGTKKCFPAGEHIELRAQESKSRRLSLIDGNIMGNSRSETSGICARVYRGGFYGFASSSEYNEASVSEVLAAARKNADFMSGHLSSSKKQFAWLPGGFTDTAREYSDPEQKYYLDFLREIDNYVAERYKKLKSRIISGNSDSREKLLVVSDGRGYHDISPRSYMYVTMCDEDGEGKPVELTEVFGGFGSFDMNFINPADCFAKIDGLYERIMRKKEAVYADAGVKTCILNPLLTGMLAHEAVGHTVEADLVIAGSVAGPNLGKTVASEKISLVDFASEAFGKRAPLPVYVDDEGTPAKDALIIDRGQLVGFMNSRESAEHYNMEPCGNARAFAYSDEPLIRMRNTAVLPGTDKIEDMIASVEDGYYLTDTNNGQADTTGEFMFGVTMGYEIRHGKLGRAIKDTTISGVAFDMLKTVDMVSDEMEWQSSGYCGKKQPMPVGMGGPSVKCRVSIGGR